MATTPTGLREAMTVRDTWQVLADGLHVQRVHLHLDQWRGASVKEAAELGLPQELVPRHLVARPATYPVLDMDLIRAAGMYPWVNVPQQLGHDRPAATPLTVTAADTAKTLTDGLGQDGARPVTAVCEAAAWWVGAFAVIHNKSGRTLGLATLQDTTRLVALGGALRVLRALVETTGEKESTVRAAYCRAVAAAVVAEPEIPELLAQIGGLRLSDLLSTSFPWRGQFTKYESGTGAGQVE
ncbi:hypothetical protein [Streptomyces sp. NPDC101455]|uniref:hypothetical protein n=1 Tax=Streptomyces sp. NPDC101455 TaxID=3366142 RepID=UPI00382C4D38